MRENNLWIANAGDSRAVLAQEDGAELKAVDLSVDQNPNSPKEQVIQIERSLANGAHYIAHVRHQEKLAVFRFDPPLTVVVSCPVQGLHIPFRAVRKYKIRSSPRNTTLRKRKPPRTEVRREEVKLTQPSHGYPCCCS